MRVPHWAIDVSIKFWAWETLITM